MREVRGPEVERPAASPEPPSSTRHGIAAGLLVIGLLAGFVAGFLIGQRTAPPSGPRVVDTPRPAPAGSLTVPTVAAESPVVEDRVIVPPDDPVVPAATPAAAPVTSSAGSRPEAPRPAPALPAMLELASRPAGATVYVDDVRVGITPVTVNDVRPGTRRVRMELPDHQPWTTSVDVVPGAHLRIGASLE